MTISLILIFASFALFAYWFRYSCALILRTRTAEDFASDVARANGLSFAAVRGQIEAGDTSNSAELFRLLQRDYEIVTKMMDRMDAAAKEQNMLENSLLRFNFQVSRLSFQASRALGLKSATAALEDMAETVSHFANTFGEWSSVSAAA